MANCSIDGICFVVNKLIQAAVPVVVTFLAQTLTNREYRWTTMSYDELCKVVNDAYRENPDIRIRTLAQELGVPFNIVWECVGFRDWFDFYDTEDD
jgi:hypothetical protein